MTTAERPANGGAPLTTGEEVAFSVPAAGTGNATLRRWWSAKRAAKKAGRRWWVTPRDRELWIIHENIWWPCFESDPPYSYRRADWCSTCQGWSQVRIAAATRGWRGPTTARRDIRYRWFLQDVAAVLPGLPVLAASVATRVEYAASVARRRADRAEALAGGGQSG